MSDSSKYINTYVQLAVDQVHSYLNDILQLKTQLKVANDLVQEKDQVISSLHEKENVSKNMQDEINSLQSNAKNWESQYNAMANKASQIDTLTNQFNEIKKQLVSEMEKNGRLNDIVNKLNEQLKLKTQETSELQTKFDNVSKSLAKYEKTNTKPVVKKVINKKESKIEENDDF